MHLNVGATSHKIEEEVVVHQKTIEAIMGKPSFPPPPPVYWL